MATFFKSITPPKNIVKAVIFGLFAILGIVLIQNFIFRIYHVTGTSMEHTLKNGDLLLVNKIGRTISNLSNKYFIPPRGSLIVFKNPLLQSNEESIVKRVIGLPGDRVVLHAGQFTVYNPEQPAGFNPDHTVSNLKLPSSGEVDRIVPESELFVVGDNREGNYSLDSRNGLSTIPLRSIEGIVLWRIFPFTTWRSF